MFSDDASLRFAPEAPGSRIGADALMTATDRDPERLLPLQAMWAVCLSAAFFLIYNGSNWLTSRRADVGTLYAPWERHIPFVPLMILPYMSIDLFFFFSPFVCRTHGRLMAHGRRTLLAVGVAGACFLLFPLQMGAPRPPVSGNAGRAFAFLALFDRPYNLVPSLHIALLCLLWVVYCRVTRGVLQTALKAWFVLIAASTLLTYQHHVIDVISGYGLGLICLYVFPDGVIGRRSAIARMQSRQLRNLRVGRNYVIGATTLALLGFLTRPWGLLLLWPAIAGAIVAAGYFWLGTSVFRKVDGRLPWSSRVILGPFFLVAWLVRRRFRKRCDPFCEVTPGIFVGGKLSPSQARSLRERGVGAVLDMTAECQEAAPLRDLPYLNIPLLDLTSPTVAELETGVQFMRAHADRGVYVHCAIGYSRSVCMIAAWLIATRQAPSVESSFQAISKVRSVALLDARSRRVLQAYLQKAAIT